MRWNLKTIRNITIAERVLRLMAFVKIGPNDIQSRHLKERINAHFSDSLATTEEMDVLADVVAVAFQSDCKCTHEELVSERSSACARRRGKPFITDCSCILCRAINTVWLDDEWGSGQEPAKATAAEPVEEKAIDPIQYDDPVQERKRKQKRDAHSTQAIRNKATEETVAEQAPPEADPDGSDTEEAETGDTGTG